MTIEEKIDFIGGYEAFNIRPYSHLGIPEIHMADGPVGLRSNDPSTAYPASINLAASWDKQLAYQTGKALGMEARAKNVHIVLGPGFNIYRLPVNGRNFEYLGEDPYLAGQIAKDYIIGMQEQGVAATAKHYVGNNQEYDRDNVSSDIDERTLREIYLPAFKTAVTHGQVASVMTGYNPLNGIHMSEHRYLNNDVLKGDWDFQGFVMSDWVSTYDGVAAATGGLDLEMPSGKFMNREILLPALNNGTITEAQINDKVRRILGIYERFNWFDKPDLSKEFQLDVNYPRQVAMDAARGGMVLLKNDNNLLPINPDKVKNIVVIGPNGDISVAGGGGSSRVKPLHDLSLEAAVTQLGNKHNIDVSFKKGIYVGAPFPKDLFEDFPFYVYQDDKKIQGANAEFFLGTKLQGEPIFERYYKTVKLENEDFWGDSPVPKNDFSARFTSYFTPEESGYYALGCIGNDGYRIFVDDKEVLNVWRSQGPTPGKEDVFLNSGQEYKIVVEYFQGGGTSMLFQGIKKVVLDKSLNQFHGLAVDAAKNADLVVMSVGFSYETEGESYDRKFEMPHNQNQLIKDIAAVNDQVVVVLNAGGNVDMSSWIDKVDGLLMAWYPGQEGNLAAAEILFGTTNPSGKLPASFEAEIEDNPTFDHYFDHDKDLRVSYGEGLFMGYRYWDQAQQKPRFPFGFGLSYTEFNYGVIKTQKDHFKLNEPVQFSIDISNTGNMDGAEVVQVYIKDVVSSLPRPVKELKAFEKIHLTKGTTKTLVFELNKDAFSFFDPEQKSWIVEPGEFEILVGSSSADIKQSLSISLK
jgi:beta-glucosidase